jgi:hypothetical protein
MVENKQINLDRFFGLSYPCTWVSWLYSHPSIVQEVILDLCQNTPYLLPCYMTSIPSSRSRGRFSKWNVKFFRVNIILPATRCYCQNVALCQFIRNQHDQMPSHSQHYFPSIPALSLLHAISPPKKLNQDRQTLLTKVTHSYNLVMSIVKLDRLACSRWETWISQVALTKHTNTTRTQPRCLGEMKLNRVYIPQKVRACMLLPGFAVIVWWEKVCILRSTSRVKGCWCEWSTVRWAIAPSVHWFRVYFFLYTENWPKCFSNTGR